jgi:broad specificity phosphatase PhoE
MLRVRYLSHPEVQIDPAVPIPNWGLSDTGRARTSALARSGRLVGTRHIFCSDEEKAKETAGILGATLGVVPVVAANMGENDRSATGFLPPDEFEDVADTFFAQPTNSILGWERAVDAQARIVASVDSVLDHTTKGDVLIVGHGAVGTLLWCALSDLPISRRHDQTRGGSFYTFDLEDRRPIAGWQSMEELA